MHRAESTATSRQQADNLAGTERAMWLHCEELQGINKQAADVRHATPQLWARFCMAQLLMACLHANL